MRKRAPKEDSNQTAHPQANVQGDLNLRWAHMFKCTFSDVSWLIFISL